MLYFYVYFYHFVLQVAAPAGESKKGLFRVHQITLLVVCFLDANVKKQLQRVEERLSKDFEKEKALYKGMFNKQKQAEEDAVEKNPNQV